MATVVVAYLGPHDGGSQRAHVAEAHGAAEFADRDVVDGGDFLYRRKVVIHDLANNSPEASGWFLEAGLKVGHHLRADRLLGSIGEVFRHGVFQHGLEVAAVASGDLAHLRQQLPVRLGWKISRVQPLFSPHVSGMDSRVRGNDATRTDESVCQATAIRSDGPETS